ncbi:MAG: M81 family metallopeptidase, partial [Halioglobus sp.]|nr:M81 family metallopeptidase [Halioglobus sp.]
MRAAGQLRAYVGAITHETNAFSPVPTRLADYGYAIIGYEDLIDAARSADCDVVEGMSRRAAPSAPTGKADFESLRDALIADISAAPDLDMVL